jgi:hypothetical protein
MSEGTIMGSRAGARVSGAFEDEQLYRPGRRDRRSARGCCRTSL